MVIQLFSVDNVFWCCESHPLPHKCYICIHRMPLCTYHSAPLLCQQTRTNALGNLLTLAVRALVTHDRGVLSIIHDDIVQASSRHPDNIIIGPRQRHNVPCFVATHWQLWWKFTGQSARKLLPNPAEQHKYPPNEAALIVICSWHNPICNIRIPDTDRARFAGLDT